MKIHKLFIMLTGAISISLFPLVNSQAENIYGWELMTEQERIEHRNTIRNLETNEERERYRMEHHRKMLERANERGLDMPEMPPHRMRDGSGMRR